MNKRIKELIEQCEHTSTSYFDGRGNVTETYFDREKFAELILADIDRIIDELYHALPLEQAVVLLTLDENIKEHFYVTENEQQD